MEEPAPQVRRLPSLCIHQTCNYRTLLLRVWVGTHGLTELLQGVHGILHVDPEAEPPQRDLVVGHGEGQLSGGAVDDLRE